MKERHDAEHLTEGELASAVALPFGVDQVVRLPVLKDVGKVIKTVEQGNGRAPYEKVFTCLNDTDTESRSCLTWEPPPYPRCRGCQATTTGRSRLSLSLEGFSKHLQGSKGTETLAPLSRIGVKTVWNCSSGHR